MEMTTFLQSASHTTLFHGVCVSYNFYVEISNYKITQQQQRQKISYKYMIRGLN